MARQVDGVEEPVGHGLEHEELSLDLPESREAFDVMARFFRTYLHRAASDGASAAAATTRPRARRRPRLGTAAPTWRPCGR